MVTANTFINAVRNNRDIPIFRLGDGNEEEILDHRLVYSAPFGQEAVHLVDDNRMQIDNQALPTPVSITRLQIEAFLGFLGNRHSFSRYRNVIGHGLWKAVYGVLDNYAYPARDIRNNQAGFKTEAVVACRKCFVYLPTRIITIDHQRPQAGGADLAVLRVFRGLGLTVGAPRDQGKNHRSVVAMAARVGGNPTPQQAQRKSAPLKTMNDAGAIYYSVIKQLNNLTWLRKKCMHHYLNLRPLCGPCNSSLSNSNIW